MAVDFLASNLYHISDTTNSFYRRMMHEEDVRPPNEKSHAYHLALLTTDVILLTDHSCNSCSPQKHILGMASVNLWFHLPKILFPSLQLKLLDIAQR